MSSYPTQSRYPDTESTSPCPILIMPGAWLITNKYRFLRIWFDSNMVRTHRETKMANGSSPHSATSSGVLQSSHIKNGRCNVYVNINKTTIRCQLFPLINITWYIYCLSPYPEKTIHPRHLHLGLWSIKYSLYPLDDAVEPPAGDTRRLLNGAMGGWVRFKVTDGRS